MEDRDYLPNKKERKAIYTKLLKEVEKWARNCSNASICTKLWYLFVNHYPTEMDFEETDEWVDPCDLMSKEMFKKFPEFAKAYEKYYVPHRFSLLTDETRPLALQMAIELCDKEM